MLTLVLIIWNARAVEIKPTHSGISKFSDQQTSECLNWAIKLKKRDDSSLVMNMDSDMYEFTYGYYNYKENRLGMEIRYDEDTGWDIRAMGNNIVRVPETFIKLWQCISDATEKAALSKGFHSSKSHDYFILLPRRSIKRDDLNFDENQCKALTHLFNIEEKIIKTNLGDYKMEFVEEYDGSHCWTIDEINGNRLRNPSKMKFVTFCYSKSQNKWIVEQLKVDKFDVLNTERVSAGAFLKLFDCIATLSEKPVELNMENIVIDDQYLHDHGFPKIGAQTSIMDFPQQVHLENDCKETADKWIQNDEWLSVKISGHEFTFRKAYGGMRKLKKIDGDYLKEVNGEYEYVDFKVRDTNMEIWAMFLKKLRQKNPRFGNLRGKYFMELFVCMSKATQKKIDVHDTSHKEKDGNDHEGKHYYEQFGFKQGINDENWEFVPVIRRMRYIY